MWASPPVCHSLSARWWPESGSRPAAPPPRPPCFLGKLSGLALLVPGRRSRARRPQNLAPSASEHRRLHRATEWRHQPTGAITAARPAVTSQRGERGIRERASLRFNSEFSLIQLCAFWEDVNALEITMHLKICFSREPLHIHPHSCSSTYLHYLLITHTDTWWIF